MKLLIINGPNLNMIGKREEKFYGVEDFEKILKGLRASFPELEIDYYQSNIEGEIISRIQSMQEAGYQGLIINAGGYSHTSVAILDALLILDIPSMEVHFSNIYAREEFRRVSLLSRACNGVVAGLGKQSYKLALHWFNENRRKKIGF